MYLMEFISIILHEEYRGTISTTLVLSLSIAANWFPEEERCLISSGQIDGRSWARLTVHDL